MTNPKPTEILSREHRVIEQVLDCLSALSQAVEAGRPLETDVAADVLEVLATFADRCHHGKEEDQLFPAIERRGLPRKVGPMAVMLSEHELGRAALAEMRGALAGSRTEAPGAAQRFHRAAASYVELLRAHISKEDNVLFPLAESLLDDAGRAEVLAGFERAEQALPAGTHQRALALADQLAARFGVPLAAQRRAPVAAGGCCHSHN